MIAHGESDGRMANEIEAGVLNVKAVDSIWLWVCYNKIPIYPIVYLLKGNYTLLNEYSGLGVPL